MQFASAWADSFLWHSWFAWHPVYVASLRRNVWLERVERRRAGNVYDIWWEYRAEPAALGALASSVTTVSPGRERPAAE